MLKVAIALGLLAASPQKALDDAEAYMLLGDPRTALSLIDQQDSTDLSLTKARMRALGMAKDKERLLEAFFKLNKPIASDEEVLDQVAWGVVEWAAASSSVHLRRMALISAGISRRESGVVIVEKMLEDPSSEIRGIAAYFSSALRDERLVQAVMHRLEKEPSGYVRPELIRALGEMRARVALPALKKLMASPTLKAEEGALARLSCEMIGDVSENGLFTAPSPSLRAYAARLAALENRQSDFDQVLALTSDPSSEVRTSALFSLYTLSYSPEQIALFKEAALKGLADSNPDVQLIAAKVLMPYREPKSRSKLLELIRSDRLKVARKAAGVLSQSGTFAVPYFKEAFIHSKDPIVHLNLSMGMLLHRTLEKEAQSAIEYILTHPDIKLGRMDIGGAGGAYAEALGSFDYQIEEGNLMERLSLLDRLAHIDYKRARELSPNLLRRRQWGSLISLATSWLKKSPDLALELVASHLDNPDWAIRVQAALLLTHLRADEKAKEVLIQCFRDPKAPRSAKLGILEGMLQVDARGSLDFFASILNEPYELLQVAAAGCIISALDR